VVIPKELRRNINVKEGDKFEIFATSNGEIILRKATVEEIDGVMVKIAEPTPAAPKTEPPQETKTVHFVNEYNESKPLVLKVTPKQYALLEFLSDWDVFGANLNMYDGLPDIDIEDFT
jgi:AbrB family looped-hinge helix DNA binding protein